MKTFKYIYAGAVALSLTLSSCGESFLNAGYTGALDEEKTAEAASKDNTAFLNGLWSWMTQRQSSDDDECTDYMSTLISKDLMTSDIVIAASSSWYIFDYQSNNRMAQWRRTQHEWKTYYTMVAKANEIINVYPEPETVDDKGLVGQAMAVRGLAYMNLIQVYQNCVDENGKIASSRPGVPLIYTNADGKSKEEMENAKGRNTVGEVLSEVERNLTKAVEYLEAGYTRPNKDFIDANVANGLLARYYLLTQQWQKAAEAANKAHQGYTIMDKDGLYDGFISISNAEWMWGFDHDSQTYLDYGSFTSNMCSYCNGYAGSSAPRLIDASLYDLINDNDYRKALFTSPQGVISQDFIKCQKDSTLCKNNNGTTPYANLKFGYSGKLMDGDYVYMRASEMVLIEAEAYAQMGDNAKAASVMKELMEKRIPGWNKLTVDAEFVQTERRIELWGEGFAYFDLKRLNKGMDRNYTGSNHWDGSLITVPAQDVRWNYQIPENEIQENSHISQKDQNE